jgi:hypothetical protein
MSDGIACLLKAPEKTFPAGPGAGRKVHDGAWYATSVSRDTFATPSADQTGIRR